MALDRGSTLRRCTALWDTQTMIVFKIKAEEFSTISELRCIILPNLSFSISILRYRCEQASIHYKWFFITFASV